MLCCRGWSTDNGEYNAVEYFGQLRNQCLFIATYISAQIIHLEQIAIFSIFILYWSFICECFSLYEILFYKRFTQATSELNGRKWDNYSTGCSTNTENDMLWQKRTENNYLHQKHRVKNFKYVLKRTWKAGCYLLSAEQLHAKQSKDENKQEQQKKKRDDGTHAVEQRNDEISQRRPVPENRQTSISSFMTSLMTFTQRRVLRGFSLRISFAPCRCAVNSIPPLPVLFSVSIHIQVSQTNLAMLCVRVSKRVVNKGDRWLRQTIHGQSKLITAVTVDVPRRRSRKKAATFRVCVKISDRSILFFVRTRILVKHNTG